MSLYLPERAFTEMENERRTRLVDESLGRAREFFVRLQEIDPDLDLVLAHEGASVEDPRLKDGFWHIRRMNQGVADTYMPITTPDGGWAEPSDYHLDLLRERDLWRDGGVDQVYERIRAHERKLQAKAQEVREVQLDTAAIQYKASESPGVLMSTDVPWTWRAHARKDR